ncbi:MAG: rod shape-determining protein [Clostridia bacterium]|nr:rod shape-determining protein [Clostridia bacterium]
MGVNKISNDIAIDFGTLNTKIYIKGQGLVLNEPSVIAYDNIAGETIAVGEEAYKMLGRTPDSITAVYPVSGGVINDATLAEELLKALLRRVCPKTLIKPKLVISVPSGATDIEKRALRDVALMVGARSVYITLSPIAAAIGSNCDVMPQRCLMVADLGGGITDICAVSMGQPVANLSSDISGNKFTEAIITYLSEKHSLSIGYQTAEEAKKKIGTVLKSGTTNTFDVAGINLKTGAPSKLTITSDELCDAMSPVADELAEIFKNAVDSVPPENLGDVLEDGILLTGAGASLNGLIPRLKNDTELRLFLAEENDFSVIKGLAAAVENPDKLPKELFEIYNV